MLPSDYGGVVVQIDANDPTVCQPWDERTLQLFQDAATRLEEHLRKGQNVLVVCRGGKNRSVALALAASKLAGIDASYLGKPQDVHMMSLVENIGNLSTLAPFAPPRATKRGASEAYRIATHVPNARPRPLGM